MNTATRRRLLQTNPWLVDPAAFERERKRRLPTPFVKRRLDLAAVAEPGRACLVVGPRQVGKSTLVWSHLAGRKAEEVLLLNAEEQLIRSWAASPAEVLADLGAELPSVRTVFIEEAQQLDEAGLLVKGLVDARRGLEVLVTGSSSYHLAARTRESLAGRAVRRRLLPLTLGELLAHEAHRVPAVRRQRAQEILARQLVLGAYPSVWFHADPTRHLGDLVEAFVLRDASDRFAIRNPDAFRRLLVFAAGQVGQMVNYSEWAAHLGVAGSTVAEWLGLLEETWVLRRLPPFAGGRRQEITGSGRLHFYDMGVRNALLGRFDSDPETRADRGALVEGWVFGALCKVLPRGWTLHYWRSRGGAEVDFVLAGGERLVALEVKAGGRSRLTRSMRSFQAAYEPQLILMVNGALEQRRAERLGRSEVLHLPLVELEAAIEERVAPVA